MTTCSKCGAFITYDNSNLLIQCRDCSGAGVKSVPRPNTGPELCDCCKHWRSPVPTVTTNRVPQAPLGNLSPTLDEAEAAYWRKTYKAAALTGIMAVRRTRSAIELSEVAGQLADAMLAEDAAHEGKEPA